ncbi:MAG: ribulose-phosphate 3-epimerase [Thermoguttaceae bacterium]|nr:ribulose-phosphate 3-epimerase [Thermoguttaceae bacterium]
MSDESWISEALRERATIVPSLLACDFANLERELHKLEEGGVKVAHIDVMDGRLVPNISVGVPVVSSIRKVTTLKLDAHLMIVEPERYIEAFRNAGADSISIHIEACPCPTAALNRIRELGAVPGLVLNYGTPIEKILPYAKEADILLVMSVPAGFGGQKFHYDSLETVRALRAAARPDPLIEIDGGIDENTIGSAAEAGVNLFVAGTSVFRSQDYGAQVSLLKKIALDASSKRRSV